MLTKLERKLADGSPSAKRGVMMDFLMQELHDLVAVFARPILKETPLTILKANRPLPITQHLAPSRR